MASVLLFLWSCDAATSPLPSSAAEQTSYLSRFDIQHQSEFELAQKHLTSIEKWIKIECLNHRFLDFKFLSSSSEETCQKDRVRKITFARQERHSRTWSLEEWWKSQCTFINSLILCPFNDYWYLKVLKNTESRLIKWSAFMFIWKPPLLLITVSSAIRRCWRPSPSTRCPCWGYHCRGSQSSWS